MSIYSTLLSYTNIVLTVTSFGTGLKRFVAFDNDLEVLSGLEILKVNPEITSKLFEHPLENGAVIADHRILNPKTVNIQAYISSDDINTLKELNYYYIAGLPLKIRAENYVINNAYIEQQPLEISGSSLDKCLYSITFKEAEVVSPVYVGSVKNPASASRVKTGVKQAKQVKRSWLVSAIFGGRTN